MINPNIVGRLFRGNHGEKLMNNLSQQDLGNTTFPGMGTVFFGTTYTFFPAITKVVGVHSTTLRAFFTAMPGVLRRCQLCRCPIKTEWSGYVVHFTI